MLIAGGVFLALAGTGAAYVAYRLSTGGRVSEIDVAEAVERFREDVGATTTSSSPTTTVPSTATSSSTTSMTTTTETVRSEPATTTTTTTTTPSAPPALPQPGVYRYATTGFDQIDALNGARHQYPAETAMTISPHGCGVRLRWDVAKERWDTWDWCLEGAGIRLVATTTYHEFFGIAGMNEYVCAGDPQPLDAEPGTRWTTVCRAGEGDTSTKHGVVVERGSFTVGGVEVPALHVRYDVDVVGDSNGTQTIDGWYRTTDGLMLQESLAVNTEQDSPIGQVAFEERASIELLTLTPLT